MKRTNVDLKQLRGWCLTALIFWSALVNGSLCLFARNEWRSVEYIGKEIGLTSIRKDYVYQIWNARHGGIYSYVKEKKQSDPSVKSTEELSKWDIITKGGKVLTLINPAQMVREVYEIEQDIHGVRGYITGLKLIRSENEPDAWEKKALLRFRQGAQEFSELMMPAKHMRVMIPTIMRKSCLKCHAEQGYKIGDIRGGISIIFPVDRIVSAFWQNFTSSIFYHLLIYFIGISALTIFYLQTSRQLVRRAIFENKLSAQEQYLQGIVDNISNGIAVYEYRKNENRFITKSINPVGLRILQSAQPEASDSPIASEKVVLLDAAETGIADVLRRVWDKGRAERFSISIGPAKRVNRAEQAGEEAIAQWLEYSVDKLPGGDLIAVFEDVTSRKKAEEKLLRKTEEWENTFDAIPDIITLQDKNMRIIRANQAAFEFFRRPPEQVLGSTCHSLFRNAEEPCSDCPGIRAMRDMQKHCCTIEHKPVCKFFYVCASPVLNSENEFRYFVYIAHDITDKKKLEEELFQAQKMEAIGTLAGGIAHDFNNILAAILGYTELAKMELPKGSNVYNDLEQVVIAGNRATDLVKQILTFSRKSKHRRKPLRIYLIVKEAVKMMRSSLPSTIDIQANINPNSGMVLADPTSIHQIIFNLCTNASHAIGPKQGKMEITLRRTELNQAQVAEKADAVPGSFIVLTVRDDGAGMNEETMSRIFDPYFTTKKQGAGTGLGLAVTHGVIEDCQGFIEVESVKGKGSAFHVYLPVLPEHGGEFQEKKHSIQLPTGEEQILFVDDEPAITHISRSILSTLGYTVIAETESIKALERFREDPASFDLLITDHTMPGLSGSELAEAVLQMRPDLPVILCTGYTSALSEQAAVALGIRKYAVKPLNAEKLAGIIREVLDHDKSTGAQPT